MSKYSNIYDIDGNIIRKAEEGSFTLEETENLVDELAEKVKNNPTNEVYKVYLNNAQKWLFNLYNKMNKEDVLKRMSVLQNSLEEAKNESNEEHKEAIEKINEEIEKLKQEYEESAKSQEDMLVERDEVKTIMNEDVYE